MIQEAIKSHWDVDLELEEIRIDYSPDGFGDYTTNVAMALAKTAKSNPMEIAEEIVGYLHPFCHSERAQRPKNLNDEILRGVYPEQSRGTQDDNRECLFENIEVIKPGFINFYLTQEYLQKQVGVILDAKENFGKSQIGAGQKIQVEFISANPTGPLTLGNGRGGFYGDVLANVLTKAGYGVEREYYINDMGEQIAKLGHSYFQDEKAVYKGKYLDEIRDKYGKEIDLYLKGEENNCPKNMKQFFNPAIIVGERVANIILDNYIKKVIEKRMKIKFDEWFKESSLLKEMNVIIGEFMDTGLAERKDDGSIWFKSTEFGDDKDWVIVKSRSEESDDDISRKTYLLSDIAYIRNKFKRKFNKLVYIWGADHHGYISRLKAAASALGYNQENIEIIIMQLVRLMSGGKEMRMSKRAGTYVTLDELLDEIPLDVARFFFLIYSPDTHMSFDLDLAKEQSQKNPVYYIQYAYARICSIFVKSEVGSIKYEGADLNLIKEQSELKLIKQLIRFPEIVEDIVKDYQVHRLPHYALDLVRQFHKFYEECRVIDEKNPALMEARLALVRATQIVLKNVLELMGISAPEKM